MITLYGIPNCDTVKKARAWLTGHAVAHGFHDFKRQGVPEDRLDAWLLAVGWEPLVNRQGTTWRKLDAATQNSVQDAASARRVLLANTSLIKRPVMEWPAADAAGQRVTVGFKPDQWLGRI